MTIAHLNFHFLITVQITIAPTTQEAMTMMIVRVAFPMPFDVAPETSSIDCEGVAEANEFVTVKVSWTLVTVGSVEVVGVEVVAGVEVVDVGVWDEEGVELVVLLLVVELEAVEELVDDNDVVDKDVVEVVDAVVDVVLPLVLIV